MSNETMNDDTGDSALSYLIRGVACGLAEVLRGMEADAASRRDRSISTEVVLHRLADIAKAIDAVRDDQMRLRIQLNRLEMALVASQGLNVASSATPHGGQGDTSTPKRRRKASKRRADETVVDHYVMDERVVILPVSNDGEGADTSRRKQQG